MGGYIDLTPQRVRSIAKTVARKDRDLLLSVADSLEHHDEVIDGLQSQEREKVQRTVAALRSENVGLRRDNARLAKRVGELLEAIVQLQKASGDMRAG